MKRKSSYPRVSQGNPGDNVFSLREAKGWSQRELAINCSVDHTTIRRLENNLGYTQNTLQKAATALGVKVDELFYSSDIKDIMALKKSKRKEIMSIVRSLLPTNSNINK